LRIVFQEENRGKGSSVRCALELARGEWIIVQDADLEYDPQDYLKLLNVAEGGRRRRDAVFGTRLVRGSEVRNQQPRAAFYYGRVGLSVAFRVLYGSPLSDVATCYKLIRRTVAQNLSLHGEGFDLDFEIAAKLRRAGVRIHEIPISYAPRTALEGKKIRAVRDGLRAIWTLGKYRIVK
jgi:glycosyltransferase involved in cell wall biosynthesis